MVDVRMMRDVGIAILLALPTLALTRPVATDAFAPGASQSTIIANASAVSMTPEERRAAMPLSD